MAVPVCSQLDADTETAVSAFLKLAEGESQAFLFESVEGGERMGRFSFLGARPKSVFRYRLGDALSPFDYAAQFLSRHRALRLPQMPRFTGGLVGNLSYDVIRLLEPHVPLSKPDEVGFPDALLMDFDTVVAFDNLRHTASVITQVRCSAGDDPKQLYEEAQQRILQVRERLRRPFTDARPQPGLAVPKLKPRQSRQSFESAVKKVLGHLRAGDAQQVVLSQRFDARSELPPFELYRALRRVNPSPYLYYVQDGDRALVGSSPETLVKVEDGEVVLRPIAGTRRRGVTADEDKALEKDLLADPKEAAEHAMLVDLGRNDVGRVCKPGTVKVVRYREVERYSHVLHMVSEVRGQLNDELTGLDVLKATFPAGTVSGAPKVRAMQIIDDLEVARRGPYAGCVGYLGLEGNLELAIAIRTLVQSGNQLSVQSGAGIVHDSQPKLEYEETLNKARALFAAVAAASNVEEGLDASQRSNVQSIVGAVRSKPAVAKGGSVRPRILVIDNYDSFTFNLVQYLGELGADVEVHRNDAVSIAQISKLNPDGLLLSPGPGTPSDAGITLETISAFAGLMPILGVCLGHQAIGQAFGGNVIRADEVVHGKTSAVLHKKEGVFADLPSPFQVGRYHALAVEKKSLPSVLKVTAWVDDGTIMGLRHRKLDVEGVQFHPESILSTHGHALLSSWLKRVEAKRSKRPAKRASL